MAVLTAVCPPLRIAFKAAALCYSHVGAGSQVIKKGGILGGWEEVAVVEGPLKWVYFLLPQVRLSPSGVLRMMCIYCLPVQIWRSWWYRSLNCLVLWAIILTKMCVIYVITAFRKKHLTCKKAKQVLRVLRAFFLDEPLPAVAAPGSAGHNY